jgi:tRNA threonylcarbamoyl adenosine modification protein YeaZ
MNVLAVDTTRNILIVLFVKDGKVYSRKSLSGRSGHMSLLFVKIDEVLKEAGADIDDVDVFAGVVGPGSYTGIRIGICALNAMARAIKKRLVAVDSLEILACSAINPHDTVCLIDNGHDYYALRTSDTGKEYFILQKDKVNSLGNAVLIRDDNKYYIDELIRVIEDKCERDEYTDFLTPKYMKKSQAEREAEGLQ